MLYFLAPKCWKYDRLETLKLTKNFLGEHVPGTRTVMFLMPFVSDNDWDLLQLQFANPRSAERVGNFPGARDYNPKWKLSITRV